MNKEARDQFEDQEINESLSRYESMLDSGEMSYFDVFQFEQIIDFFLEDDDPENAYKALEVGLSMHPSSIALQICKCKVLLSMNEYSLAGQMAEDLLKIETSDPDLHLIKGASLLMNGQDEEAADFFNVAISNSASDIDETLYHIGCSYELCERYGEAVEFFEKAYEINSLHDGVIYELAYCYEKIGEDSQSQIFYDRFLDLDPYSDSAWFNLGIVYNKLGATEKAIEAYEFAIAINEDFPNAYFNLGHCYLSLENYEKTIEAYENYLKTDQENDDILCVLAECYQKLKKNDVSLHYFERALNKNSKNSFACYGCGIQQAKAKNYQLAKTYFRKALQIEPENAEFWYRLALSCKEHGALKEGKNAFEKCCSLAPSVLDYWLCYAEFLYNQGMSIRAIEKLEDASLVLPRESLIYYYLSAFYLEKENKKQALSNLKKALEINSENYKILFDIYPDATYCTEVQNLISSYTNPGEF